MRDRQRRSSSRGAESILWLICCLLPSDILAQTLTGRVLEEGRETPVPGAAVFMMSQDGARLNEATSDSLGRFVIELPEDIEFLLQVERLGYEIARTPLFSSESGTPPEIEIMVWPISLPLPGFDVSVEREAERFLGLFGHTPQTLSERWIDRERIEAMGMPGLPKDLIRRQNVAGLWVTEVNPSENRPALCVTFQRGRGCALTVLNGSVISPQAAYWIDPNTLESVAILRPPDATTFYGTRAAGGAVLMWTRTGGR